MHMFGAHSPLAPYTPSARGVRSTDIIATAHSPRHLLLEVTAVHHETFRNPEGRTLAVVRYDGWELIGGWETDGDGKLRHSYDRTRRVERGWGQPAGTRVTVVGTTRELSWSLLDAIETARIFGGRYPS